MASLASIKDFLKRARIDISGFVEKPEFVQAYESVLSKGVRHDYVTKIGGLNTIVQVNSPKPDAAVFVFHGFGANKEDLADLGDYMHTAMKGKNLVCFFPDAPMDLGWGGAYAWWPINMEKLMRQTAAKDVTGIKREKPEGMDEARAKVLNFIDEAMKQFGVPADNFALCGFSQGSMLSMDMTMHLPTPPKAVGLFSSVVIAEGDWIKQLEGASEQKKQLWKDIAIVQSHGQQDTIIPIEGGEIMGEWIKQLGAEREWFPFNGPHTLTPVAIRRFADVCKEKLFG